MWFSYLCYIIALCGFFLFFLVPLVAQAVRLVNVPVQQGKSITIPCFYDPKYIYDKKQLCWGYSFNICRDDKEKKHRTVSISDDQTQHIFTVTMKNVTMTDTNYYWCFVDNADHPPFTYFYLDVTRGEMQKLLCTIYLCS